MVRNQTQTRRGNLILPHQKYCSVQGRHNAPSPVDTLLCFCTEPFLSGKPKILHHERLGPQDSSQDWVEMEPEAKLAALVVAYRGELPRLDFVRLPCMIAAGSHVEWASVVVEKQIVGAEVEQSQA